MTSEAPHRPGQEPGEVSPGAGGPAPYGDHPAQQDNGYPGAGDLGWAPPPPAGPPTQPALAWGQPGDQPVAGRAAAQVPSAEPAAWGGSPQPAWAPPQQAGTAWDAAEQGAPAWAATPPAPFGESAPPAWAAAPTNVSPEPAASAWPAPAEQDATATAGPQGDPNRNGGWGGPQQGDQPAWGQQGETIPPAWAPDAPARASAKVSVPGSPADNWPAQDDPDRSGGWAAGRAAGQAEAPQPSAWGTPDEQRPTWGDSAPAPQQYDQDRPADERPGQWAPEHPAIPEAEPWAPGEAWGRPEAEPGEAASNGREPARADEAPIYQPAPGPGISAANAVPLPPQEQRVPGAALASAPPDDYLPPAHFAPAAEPADRAYEPEQAAWGAAGSTHDEPQSPAGPMVPGPRTSPESGAAGAVSASASVPMASRLTPPADQPLHAAGVPAPQPRVYGRPTRAESDEFPGQDAPNGFPEAGPRFDEPGPQPRFDEPDRSAAPNAFAEAPPAPPSPAGPPPFPPGVPSFVDPAGSNRPVNGVHPHSDERPGDPFGGPGTRPDPFGTPGGQPDPFGGPGGQADPFGTPGSQPDPFGGPGGQPDPFGTPGSQPDPFGGPGGQPSPFGGPGGPPEPFGTPGGQPNPFGGPAGGRASAAVPGPGPMGEPGQGNFPPPFPPPAPPAWSQGPASEPEQGRFDAFKPEAEPPAEAPAPKVRNGRVLAAVLIAAVLILGVPLGTLKLLGKLGGSNEPAPFNPAVGSCVKQSGTSAAAADCAEPGAFKVVARVESKDKCPDPNQPTVKLNGVEANRLVCLKPAGQ